MKEEKTAFSPLDLLSTILNGSRTYPHKEIVGKVSSFRWSKQIVTSLYVTILHFNHKHSTILDIWQAKNSNYMAQRVWAKQNKGNSYTIRTKGQSSLQF